MKTKKSKKVIALLLMVMVSLMVTSSFALAGDVPSPSSSIKEKMSSANQDATQIVGQADQITGRVIQVARGLGILGLFIFAIWAGYGLAVAPQGQGIAAIKGRLVGIIVFAILLFRTEDIVVFLLKLLGVTDLSGFGL